MVLAFVALVVLGGILSALEEPTEETAASPTDVPSVVATGTPNVEPEEPVQIQERVNVPPVVGKRLVNAKDVLKRADLLVSVVRKYSSKPAGTVLLQSISAGTEVRAGRTIRLVISKGSRPQPSPDCTNGYSPCLIYHGGSDYDCYGGSGDGPYYTEPGIVYTVSGSDPYGLDADNDGYGCE